MQQANKTVHVFPFQTYEQAVSRDKFHHLTKNNYIWLKKEKRKNKEQKPDLK